MTRFLESAASREVSTSLARDDAGQAGAGEPLTVRIPRAIELTGIGRSKLYELIADGEIEVVKVGSSTLVIFASLKALVARLRGLR